MKNNRKNGRLELSDLSASGKTISESQLQLAIGGTNIGSAIGSAAAKVKSDATKFEFATDRPDLGMTVIDSIPDLLA